MDDSLGNRKCVIYMKKEAFAQPKNTQKYLILGNFNILQQILDEQTIPS